MSKSSQQQRHNQEGASGFECKAEARDEQLKLCLCRASGDSRTAESEIAEDEAQLTEADEESTAEEAQEPESNVNEHSDSEVTSTLIGKVHWEDKCRKSVDMKIRVLKNTSSPYTITEEDQEDLAREEQGEHSDSDREFLESKRS